MKLIEVVVSFFILLLFINLFTNVVTQISEYRGAALYYIEKTSDILQHHGALKYGEREVDNER